MKLLSRPAILLLLTAAVLRLAAVVVWHNQLGVDVDAYLGIAGSLRDGSGYSLPDAAGPTAYRPPLYPIVLAVILSLSGGNVWGIGLAQILWGTAAVWLTGTVASRLGLTTGASLAAMAVVAVDPLLVQYTAYPMTETLGAFLTACLLWTLTGGHATQAGPIGGALPSAGVSGLPRWQQVGFGVVLGCCLLARPTYWAVLALAAAGWCLLRLPAAGRRPLRVPWAAVVTVAVILLPWGLRNAVVFGEPVLTTTHGGYTLLLANNPVFYREVVRGAPGATWQAESLLAWQAEIERELERDNVTGEVARDRWMARRAWRNMADDPAGAVQAAWYRTRRLWSPFALGPARAGIEHVWERVLRGVTARPEPPARLAATVTAALVAAFYLTVFGLAVVGGVSAAVRRERQWAWVLWLPLGFAAVHLLYWTDARMRAPVLPAVALLAARGLVEVRRSIGSRPGARGGE